MVVPNRVALHIASYVTSCHVASRRVTSKHFTKDQVVESMIQVNHDRLYATNPVDHYIYR